jgi:hypothetical protein
MCIYVCVCYGLYLKCSPNTHALKAWVSTVVRWWGLVKGSYVLKGDMKCLPSYSLLPALHRWVVSCATHFCHDVWCYQRPQNKGTKKPWTETLSQNKSFLLLSCLSQIFCQSNGKLTNAVCVCVCVCVYKINTQRQLQRLLNKDQQKIWEDGRKYILSLTIFRSIGIGTEW